MPATPLSSAGCAAATITRAGRDHPVAEAEAALDDLHDRALVGAGHDLAW